MSLLRASWICMAAAGAAAIGVPLALLSGTEEAIEPPPRLTVTEVAATPVGGLSFALTAPPFAPDRQPEREAIPEPSAAPQVIPEAAPAPPPMLVGLVTGGGSRGVALVKGASGETMTLGPGESVDGWRLVSIGREEAVLELAGRRHSLRLDFANKPGTAVAAPKVVPAANRQPAREPLWPPEPPSAMPTAQQ